MATTKTWTVQLLIEEDGDDTRADAVLRTQDTTLRGTGRARRNPHDRSVPEIGDELAACRALSDLAHQLFDATTSDVEQATGRPAVLSG